MPDAASAARVRIAACECVTAFGATAETLAALLDRRVALQAAPVLGRDGGDAVPLALIAERSLDETAPPNWMPAVRQLAAACPEGDWGRPRRPVIVTSSNFGVGSLYAYRRTGDTAHLRYGTPFAAVDWLAEELGWGENVTTFSHACVTAHLGLLHASRLLAADLADAALIFSFDFLSPFVAGGFHALKILNQEWPAPYQDRATGAIGLGDGAAFAVLTRDRGDFRIAAQAVHNEMHHFTANRADGAGFAACIDQVATAAQGRRLWLKGHGTGTLEAGRLEATTLAARFPGRPLLSWKGSLGHTLGSCGLVELALALAAIRGGRAPGTVGSAGPTFVSEVALDSFGLGDCDAVLCTSNAFGGAHAAMLVDHG
jgi:hypothetical protein